MKRLGTTLHTRANSTLRLGNILLLSAVLFVAVLGFTAFTVDVGYIAVVKTQLQSAVDASTLAGAMELDSSEDATEVATNVKTAVMEIAALNKVGNNSGLILDPNVDIQLGRQEWNEQTQKFVYLWGSQHTPYNIVRVDGRLEVVTSNNTTTDRRLPLFFAPVIGNDKASLSSTSIATFQPRDIMLCLDFSASMNDDTEYSSIPTLGQTFVTNSITTMWNDLGSPTYGSMPFTPSFLTVGGVAADNTIPHIDVTFKGTSATLTSTLNLTTVRLKFSNGNTQTFSGLSGTTGTFAGSGSNNGKRITNVWVQSGTNANLSSEGWGEKFNFTDTDIIAHLGLNSVTYPQPGGSWSDFISYCNSNGNVVYGNFRYKYGAMSLINYWMEDYPSAANSPGKWVCSAQPVTILKNASDTLIDYITVAEADDKIGLSIYSHTNTTGAILESGLTDDWPAVKTLYRQRQAGHYTGGTNIKAGLQVARQELETNGRGMSYKMIVLMTDGLPNQGGTDPAQAARDQAQLCKTAKIRVMTVSLGSGADTSLMQEIADITGGLHFNVPGGSDYQQYEEDLKEVFRKIAANRPLRLLPGVPVN